MHDDRMLSLSDVKYDAHKQRHYYVGYILCILILAILFIFTLQRYIKSIHQAHRFEEKLSIIRDIEF